MDISESMENEAFAWDGEECLRKTLRLIWVVVSLDFILNVLIPAAFCASVHGRLDIADGCQVGLPFARAFVFCCLAWAIASRKNWARKSYVAAVSVWGGGLFWRGWMLANGGLDEGSSVFAVGLTAVLWLVFFITCLMLLRKKCAACFSPRCPDAWISRHRGLSACAWIIVAVCFGIACFRPTGLCSSDFRSTCDNAPVGKAFAIVYARIMASMGNAEAEIDLGNCYEVGRGVEQSDEEAAKWYLKAAKQGNAVAQGKIGACYYDGKGVRLSYTEAVKWWRKAVAQGNALAQLGLGRCYAQGNGVEQSDEDAKKWYLNAAEQGYPAAQVELGEYYEEKQSHEDAATWYLKAAELGEAGAQVHLASCFETGRGVRESHIEAVKWYRQAAMQGHAEAVDWFRKAAGKGDAEAKRVLGICYLEEHGVEKSEQEAVKLFQEAAKLGDAEAMNRLGACYEKGVGVERSYAKSVSWYRRAAGQGCVAAMYRLGVCYERGLGVERSYDEAKKWYSKATAMIDAEKGVGMDGHKIEQEREW